MAISRRFQARTTLPAAHHSHLLLHAAALRKQKIEVLDASPNGDGTVTVVFCGQGLGKNAIPVPPPCTCTIATDGTITIQPIE